VTIKRAAILAVICLLAIGVNASRVVGQQTTLQKKELPRVIKFDGDMAFLLAHLAETFDVTIGFEVDPKQPKPQVSIFVQDATLTDTLNAIVKSAPAYQWRERNGCIEVLPLAANSPLLDTLISNFRVSEVSQEEAVNRLLGLPEVQANLRAMSLNRKEPGSAPTATRKFSMNLESVTMRQALARIANEGPEHFWILRTFGDGSFSIGISPG